MDTPIRYNGEEVYGLRQLDRWDGVAEGSHFRRFRRLCVKLREGEHYYFLEDEQHADLLAKLRGQGAIYPGTSYCVLVTAAGRRLLRAR